MSSGSRERSAWLCYCVVVMHRDGTPVKRIRRRQKELYHGTAGQGNPGLRGATTCCGSTGSIADLTPSNKSSDRFC